MLCINTIELQFGGTLASSPMWLADKAGGMYEYYMQTMCQLP